MARQMWGEATASDRRRACRFPRLFALPSAAKVLAWLVLCGVMAWALIDGLPGG